jgi:uncharacterized protein with HEPN domain
MDKNKYSVREALADIISDCDMIFKHIERLGVTRSTMPTDYTCLDAVSKRIENIGEIVYERLSNQFKENHLEIDWHMISGMRHRLVHHYQNTKWDIVVDATYDEIPKLKEFCVGILRGLENQ